ncbi:gibberellin 20 oxidase 1-D-like [Asparagus officinalis]|uniref:gibberellin 20 oxidase 1-D-like n=1 Tax=Asparagus officinalis TaxID=4686 RepID=UPI00098E2D5C|nr:gibberellin 20 oxidase 1-D-like [Asparagus officinalis]
MANYYPRSPKPDRTLGTGPHYDPNSITILRQDDNVDGLQAQTNKRYKSCMHRAVVSSTTTRKTMVYFVSPEMDKTVRPPEELVDAEHPRAYPDFTWGMLKEFTRKHHTPDTQTLTAFVEWLKKKKEKESGNE